MTRLGDDLRVRFTRVEFECLRTITFLDEAGKTALMMAVQAGGEYFVELTTGEADSIRDACGEQLQRVGFDQSYKPTKAGVTLERLIDKLLVR
jgi:hypothetical protein